MKYNTILKTAFILSGVVAVSIAPCKSQTTYELKVTAEHQRLMIKNIPENLNIEQGKTGTISIEMGGDGKSGVAKSSSEMGLRISDLGDLIHIEGANQKRVTYSIRVPEGLIVEIVDSYWDGQGNKGNNWQTNGQIFVKKLANELTIDSKYKSVKVENSTGPLLVNTVTSHVFLDFSHVEDIPPVSAITINGNINCKFSHEQPANILVKSLKGEINKSPSIELTDVTIARGSSKMGWQYFETNKIAGYNQVYIEATYGSIKLEVKDK